MRAGKYVPAGAAALIAAAALIWNAPIAGADPSDSQSRAFTQDFRLESCTFSASGGNPYFVLEPGHQLILAGVENKEELELVITVLRDTKAISVDGLGRVVTRVVEERESLAGELVEVSRNFFAICTETNNVVYFGEDVDIYEDGRIVSHDGAWRAGRDGARPGIIMPGTFLLGSRYFQELAPEVALDRAENVAMGLTVEVPAGTFRDSVMVFETSELDTGAKSVKLYAPGVGLIVDSVARLVEWHEAP
jgi:hypothetical protein